MNELEEEVGAIYNDQGQLIKNSEAVRARNARKRAKLKARARGESPNFVRAQVISTECRKDYYALSGKEGLYQTTTYRALDPETGTTSCEVITSKVKRVGPPLLITGHEFSTVTRETLAVFLSSLQLAGTRKESDGGRGWSVNTNHVTLVIQFNGKDGQTEWQDVTDVEALAAEVEAAVYSFKKQSIQDL